jgi:energy-converting hydrogenase Eha subunit C
MVILTSNALDLLLLIAVIGAMVWHTLKYDSQLVTGAGFLLGFAAITLNPDPPYNLIAGALLVTGMTIIVLRRRWFELEIFGILASYLNHFYWLYSIFGLQTTRAPFAHHALSMALVIAYWAVFRCSYVWRKVSSHEEESVSTIAGLLNPLLFLAVMKYQSFHPEWAFYALLGLGATEFVLGQLPISRRRVAPFQVLSCLGAAFMVAAVPFKYSGNSLEMLWLAGGEAFLLAGIFTSERLFRGFGLIVSFLVALFALAGRITPLLQEVMNNQPHHHVQLGIVLTVITAVLYANAHVIGRRWPELFEEELETQALRALSFAASAFAVCAVYALVADNAIAIVLALLVFALSLLGKQLSIGDLIYQAHWIAVATVVQTIVTGRTLEITWNNVPGRVLTFVPVAGLLYLSSRYVRLSETLNQMALSSAYAWAATSLLAILIWFQSADWSMTVLWIALGIALSLVGDALKRNDLKWQAFALVLLSFGRALAVNFELTTTFHQLTYRLISVSLTAVGIYLLARWAPLSQVRPVYSVTGTFLLALLAFKETPQPWIAVAWIGLALVLAVAARFWNDRALLWQTHVLSLLSAGWTLYASFAPQYRGNVQLFSVALTAGSLYLLNWITNIADIIGDERISQAYSWAGSLLVSWLIWYQLPANDVALVWGVFGLALFLIGDWKFWPFLRAQAYVALMCSFARIFYANFNVLGAPGAARPEVATVVPLVGIYFFIYWQLHGKKASQLESKIRIEDLLACLGTATLAALARFELPLESVAIGYAVLVIATLLAAWLTRLQVFQYQALALLGMAAFRVSMFNFYHLRESFSSSLTSAVWTILLLAAGIPICLAIRRNSTQTFTGPRWATLLASHSEQPMFFVPFILMGVLLALKVDPGMITLAWGAQAVVVFVLALWAKERSFRLAGLILLLLSAAKIVLWDAWQFSDPTARYLTLIGVGVLILVVSYLISRNREALREYL